MQSKYKRKEEIVIPERSRLVEETEAHVLVGLLLLCDRVSFSNTNASSVKL